MHVISCERDTQFVLSLRACSCILMHAAPDHYMYAIAKKKKALIKVISMLCHSYQYQQVFRGYHGRYSSIDRDHQGQLSSPEYCRFMPMLPEAGFLVRCATISRQLGQGRLRSGGSPLFMINHMLLAVLTVSYLTTEGLEVWSFQLITRARDSRYRCVAYVRCMHVRRLEYSLWRKDK